jgi:glycosyltransferase involved in cell wall biosynthesis
VDKTRRKEKLSVVTPVYGNQETVESLAFQVLQKAEELFDHVEYIFVVDGSPDRSLEVLRRLALKDRRIKIINLARNFGQHAAFSAGFEAATGDFLFLIDADLEEDPKYLPEFVREMDKGSDLVVGVRKRKNKFNIFRFITSRLYGTLFNLFSEYKIIPDATTMRLMSKRYLNLLRQFSERPFLGGITAWIGVPPVLFPVDIIERPESSYTFTKRLHHAFVGLIGFSARPLRTSFFLGGTICTLAVIYGLYLAIRQLILRDVTLGFTPIVDLLAFLTGVQFMFLGVLGEFIAEIFIATKNRPRYLIFERINFEDI